MNAASSTLLIVPTLTLLYRGKPPQARVPPTPGCLQSLSFPIQSSPSLRHFLPTPPLFILSLPPPPVLDTPETILRAKVFFLHASSSSSPWLSRLRRNPFQVSSSPTPPHSAKGRQSRRRRRRSHGACGGRERMKGFSLEKERGKRRNTKRKGRRRWRWRWNGGSLTPPFLRTQSLNKPAVPPSPLPVQTNIFLHLEGGEGGKGPQHFSFPPPPQVRGRA